MFNLNFYYFTFSTYILIIGIAFIVAFIVFYKISETTFNKIDIFYSYVINTFGFAIGSKLLSLISNNIDLNFYNFINSGYSFIGGILGSLLLIVLYCKKYKLNFKNMLSRFIVIYPLIYSISKLGCFINGCCGGLINIYNINYEFPIQLISAGIMFSLFIILLLQSKKQDNSVIITFLISFGIIRFLEDFFRTSRNLLAYNITLNQVICLGFIITALVMTSFKIYHIKKEKENG